MNWIRQVLKLQKLSTLEKKSVSTYLCWKAFHHVREQELWQSRDSGESNYIFYDALSLWILLESDNSSILVTVIMKVPCSLGVENRHPTANRYNPGQSETEEWALGVGGGEVLLRPERSIWVLRDEQISRNMEGYEKCLLIKLVQMEKCGSCVGQTNDRYMRGLS